MPTSTTHRGLVKPILGDPPDISSISPNFDDIDAALEGFIDPTSAPYNVVPNSQADAGTNRTGLNAALVAASTAKKAVVWRAGDLYISGGSVDMRDLSGVSLIAATPKSRLIQVTTNTPILLVGQDAETSERIAVKNFSLEFLTAQTSSETNGVCIDILGTTLSIAKFDHLQLRYCYNGIRQASTAVLTGNTFSDITIRDTTGSAISGVGALGSSGNLFEGFHISPGTSGAPVTLTAPVISLKNYSSGTFTDTLIENVDAPSAIKLDTVFLQAFDGLQFRNVGLTDAHTGLLYLTGGTGAAVTGLTVDQCRFTSALGASRVGLVCLENTSTVTVNGAHVRANTVTSVTLSGVNTKSNSTGEVNCRATFDGVALGTNHGLTVPADTFVSSSSTVKHHPLMQWNAVKAPNSDVVTSGDADLTVYAEGYGSTVNVNVPLTATRSITLSNVQAASGDLSTVSCPRGAEFHVVRAAASTGAFFLQIKNHDGTVLTSLELAGTNASLVFDGSNWIVRSFPRTENARIVAVTGTTHTVTVADNGAILQTENNSATTLTFPPTLPLNFNAGIRQKGTGQVTVATSGSGIVSSFDGHTKTAGQRAVASVFVAENTTGSAAVLSFTGQTTS